MSAPSFSGANWRSASTSGGSDCVEVAAQDGWIGVRDSKAAGGGPVLAFTRSEWRAFLSGVTLGEFAVENLEE
jgi:hypothetical protein